jgi:ATP/ADP translocase/HEAT repeat protein/CRP-like cAMP-binding protein
MPLLQRILSPVVDVRKEESTGVALMFLYSFLAMTGYNVLKPVTRSKYISTLGADNLPYVLLVAGLVIGILMTGYAWLISRLPRKSGLPITQLGMAGLLFLFWFIFQNPSTWASVALYLFGLILGVLLISQFWTVANLVYDPRQAKRIFGFIGGGAALGGIAGSQILIRFTDSLGTTNMLLISGTLMVACAFIVWTILGRTEAQPSPEALAGKKEKGVGFGEALNLLRRSSHLQIIALVISFAAVGAAIIEQQLNMAAQASKGAGATDAITVFLAQVQQWTSIAGFIVQVWLTSKIHRYLGIGFALMVLPVSLGASAVIMLFNSGLWAPGFARVLDQSLRYTVDKTTREILFLPLPEDIKLKAKSFVDVTVDRNAKALGALLLLVLVKPWGLGLDWQRLSYASLSVMVLWIFMSLRARRGYLAAFRQSIERRDLQPSELRLNVADLSTVETLMQELAHPEPARVIYAIDVLESLDKRNLVTPLLLYHEAPAVRERTLRALEAGAAERWTPQIRRALSDADGGVRTAALRALASIGHEDAIAHARPLLAEKDPRIRTTAALALTASLKEADVDLAYETLVDVISDSSPASAAARRDVARALGALSDERFKGLLIPLLYDQDTDVAAAAMHSVRNAGSADFIFVPTLISLLRNRQVKAGARDALVAYGEAVIEPLAHFMRDTNEDIWLRRHIPTTIARIVSQKSVDVLVPALQESDGFLRYKVIAALERLRRADDALVFDRAAIEPLVIREARAFLTSLSLHHNLFVRGQLPADTLLASALQQKMARSKDRIYRLLALLYPWKDIDAAQWTLGHGDVRARSSASEYLDNILTGQVRHLVMPVLEDMPLEEKVRRANVLQKTRARNIEETLLELINDDNQVIAAVAIDVVRQQRLWTLAGDVEHVLAHRDVRDWYVFEAASWALAEQRMPAERRRELWLEPLPAAVLADRLRSLPLFASVSVDELFRIAAASKQVRHDPGTVLMTEGATQDTIHLLLDGEVSATGGHLPPDTIQAPAALGFTEALEGAPVRRSMRTPGVAVTLAMTTDELRSLLADNTELVRGLFAEMADRAEATGCAPVESTGAAGDLRQLAGEGITPVEKVLALQRVPYFKQLPAEETQQLAIITRTIPMKAGSQLFAASSPPSTWLVLSGEVRLEGPDGTLTARDGDVIGSFCALTGHEVGLNATVTRDGVALCLARDELFELMAERGELLRHMFAGIGRLASASV